MLEPIEHPVLDTEELNRFRDMFTDYGEFINYVVRYLCEVVEDKICIFKNQLTPESFTIHAPHGLSFFRDESETEEALTVKGKRSPMPFYQMMVYVYRKINRYNPGVNKFLYMIKLNRLIYYYKIFSLRSKNRLMPTISDPSHPLGDTGVVRIQSHGGHFISDDESNPLILNSISSITSSSGNKLEQLFMCSKSAYGFDTYSLKTDAYSCSIYTSKQEKNNGPILTEMYRLVSEFGFLPFDTIIFQMIELTKCRLRVDKTLQKVISNCFVAKDGPGKAMQHYINPSSSIFIEKQFSGSAAEFMHVTDVEIYNETPGTYQDKLQASDIALKLGKYKAHERLSDFKIMLSDIIRYFAERGKKKLFIYDTSCAGVSPKEKEKEVERLIMTHKIG